MFVRLYLFQKKKIIIIAIDLSKQQTLDADPKAIQQIYFTGNLERAEIHQCFSSFKKQKKLS